jgi:hypothetical protein
MEYDPEQQEEEDGDFFMDEEGNEHEIVRVAVYQDKAYWVYHNTFYEAETTLEPDFSTAQPIDIDSMTEKEMTELFEILDNLKESEKE